MVALVTLPERSKGTLRHLLNNLNLGIAAADFGGKFVALLDGSAPTLSQRELAELRHLLNNLNLGTAKLRFGHLVADLFDPAKAMNAAAAVTEKHRNELAHILNDLNLGLAEVGFGDIFSQAVVAAAIPTGPVKTIVAAADQAAATGGDVIAFTAMFTATNGATAADLNFAVNPAAAGNVNAAGQLTLAGDASGAVSVVATAKPGVYVSGSPATFNITAVTPKSITAKTGLTAAAGATMTFAQMFDVTGNVVAGDLNFTVDPAKGSQGGEVTAATGALKLDADASGDITVTATAKAGKAITGSPAIATITVS